jgi:branched-chain amino acid transport system permease protein
VGERFPTLIGLIFLVIVLVSPDGLVGLWERTVARLRGSAGPDGPTAEGGSAGTVPEGERGASTVTGS